MFVFYIIFNKLLIIILTLTIFLLLTNKTSVVETKSIIIKKQNVNNNNNNNNENKFKIKTNLTVSLNLNYNKTNTNTNTNNILENRLKNFKKENNNNNNNDNNEKNNDKTIRYLSSKKYIIDDYDNDNDNDNDYLNNYNNSENDDTTESTIYIRDIDDDGGQTTCILGTSENYLSWWVQENVSSYHLDLSKAYFNEKLIEEHLSNLSRETTLQTLKFLSIAQNSLKRIPSIGLNFFNKTLEYLSVSGNFFNIIETNNDNLETWSTFPLLLYLKELDIRNCSILHLKENTFKNIPNIEKLYLSYNQLVFISEITFNNLPNLIHLDLSYNNFSQLTMYKNVNNIDPYSQILDGILLNDKIFLNLINLKLLDLSHTKITPSSAKAFSYLNRNLQQLSLCYTGIPLIAKNMFINTDLKVLDISGNPSTSPFLTKDTFKGLENKLEILSYEYSNVKSLQWLNYLTKLSIIKLKGNNINQLTNETFYKLHTIELMDLSSNHISNWYYRIFENNKQLKILNIRDNNINIITTEMLNDFANLKFLAIGNNNFLCNCILNDFITMATYNNRNTNCTVKLPIIDEKLNEKINYLYKDNKNLIRNYQKQITNNQYNNVSLRIYENYLITIDKSYNNMRNTRRNLILESRINKQTINGENIFLINNEIQTSSITVTCNQTILKNSLQPSTPAETTKSTTTESITLNDFEKINNFTFQLLDFDRNDYICINSTNNKKYQLSEIEKCTTEQYNKNLPDTQKLTVRSSTFAIVIIIIAILFVVYLLCYYNWWYIRYFFIIVKNSTILAFLDKDKEFGKRISNNSCNNNENNYLYDVFVSYCDENRDWILNEFLPNIEEQDINVCLHERDFQVGLSILENIITSMDKSKVLLLIVSENFLLSQWCQFEMHLANYRLLETRREDLILVLLEDIPKRKRPKTLQYLMRIKTYIKWPIEQKTKIKANNIIIENIDPNMQPVNKLLNEERKLFWKRLKKAIANISSASSLTRTINRNSISSNSV